MKSSYSRALCLKMRFETTLKEIGGYKLVGKERVGQGWKAGARLIPQAKSWSSRVEKHQTPGWIYFGGCDAVGH